jgi:hypothetical protein
MVTDSKWPYQDLQLSSPNKGLPILAKYLTQARGILARRGKLKLINCHNLVGVPRSRDVDLFPSTLRRFQIAASSLVYVLERDIAEMLLRLPHNQNVRLSLPEP